MNFPDYCSATGNSKRSMFVMSTASSSGSGSGRSNDDPNHNLYSNHVTKHDPFSFLEEEDNDDCDGSLSLLLKPLRDPPISLDDLVISFKTNAVVIIQGLKLQIFSFKKRHAKFL